MNEEKLSALMTLLGLNFTAIEKAKAYLEAEGIVPTKIMVPAIEILGHPIEFGDTEKPILMAETKYDELTVSVEIKNET